MEFKELHYTRVSPHDYSKKSRYVLEVPQNTDLSITMQSFIRTSENSVDILINTYVILTQDSSFIRKDVDIYEYLIQCLSKNKLSQCFGFLCNGDFSIHTGKIHKGAIGVDVNHTNIKPVISPSNPYKTYYFMDAMLWASMNIEFESSSVVNKLIMAQPNKYLGRSIVSDEERTDVLLQDKKT